MKVKEAQHAGKSFTCKDWKVGYWISGLRIEVSPPVNTSQWSLFTTLLHTWTTSSALQMKAHMIKHRVYLKIVCSTAVADPGLFLYIKYKWRHQVLAHCGVQILNHSCCQGCSLSMLLFFLNKICIYWWLILTWYKSWLI